VLFISFLLDRVAVVTVITPLRKNMKGNLLAIESIQANVDGLNWI